MSSFAKTKCSVARIAELMQGQDTDRSQALLLIRVLPAAAAIRLLTKGLQHWSRPFRQACATCLAEHLVPSTPRSLIKAANEERISKTLAIDLLRRHECDAAVTFLASLLSGHGSPQSKVWAVKALAVLRRYKGEMAVGVLWRHSGKFDVGVRRRLSLLSNKHVQLLVGRMPFELRMDLIDRPPVRRYLTERGLAGLYADIDGTKGAEYLLANRFGDLRRLGPERIDQLTDETIAECVQGASWRLRDAMLADKRVVRCLAKRESAPIRTLFIEQAKNREKEGRSLSRLVELLGVHRATLGRFCKEWDGIEKHYTSFEVRKKSGGKRRLAAPDRSLKMVQRRIQTRILAKQPLHESCHGFRSKHSIVTNAQPHVHSEVVINLDFEDFFPSVSARRVYGIFTALGFTSFESRFLTRLTTLQNCLPQGAPTSPMLANLAARRLDSRLAGLAAKIGAHYSRYADDLTFSGSQEILGALPLVRQIITEESFKIAEKKFKISRPGTRQEVTGLTVNQSVSIPRHFRRQLRAALHRVQHGKRPHWNGQPMSLEQLKGRVAFLKVVHPKIAAGCMPILAAAQE